MRLATPSATPSAFTYNSVQTHIVRKGRKTHTKTRRVHIKNGKGFKEIIQNRRRTRKALTKKEIACIRKCQFIPGLFKSCEECTL